MPKQTISSHVGRVQLIADAYIPVSRDDPEDFVTDLLADLQHGAAALNGVSEAGRGRLAAAGTGPPRPEFAISTKMGT